MYLPTTSFTTALSRLLGWSYFLAWGISSYPQPLSNYRRKSVTGLSADYFLVNILGFACYTVSSVLFLFSGTVREQYGRRHPGGVPTVRGNDLAFAAHATLLSIVTYAQFYLPGYKRDPSQRLSRTMAAIIAACIGGILLATVLALTGVCEWIDVVYTLQYTKLLISIVKYIPQALLNARRRSTVGWSITNILLDLSGGVLSLAQLLLDSSVQRDWSGVWGNPVKFWLGQIAVGFDVLFVLQHYVFYPQGKGEGVVEEEGREGERRALLEGEGERV